MFLGADELGVGYLDSKKQQHKQVQLKSCARHLDCDQEHEEDNHIVSCFEQSPDQFLNLKPQSLSPQREPAIFGH